MTARPAVIAPGASQVHYLSTGTVVVTMFGLTIHKPGHSSLSRLHDGSLLSEEQAEQILATARLLPIPEWIDADGTFLGHSWE